jgi:hypothetical protein
MCHNGLWKPWTNRDSNVTLLKSELSSITARMTNDDQADAAHRHRYAREIDLAEEHILVRGEPMRISPH